MLCAYWEMGDLPPFSYSVGIQRSTGALEIIVIGLKQPLSHFIVNEYNSRVRGGRTLQPWTACRWVC
jgi:hypothetical protein